MNRNKKSFLLHIDSLDILDELTEDQAGKLFKAIKAYQKQEEFELDSFVRIAFSPFKNQFIRDNEKYDTTCKRRAEAGRKGGEAKSAKASKPKQEIASASNCQQELASVADSNNKNKTKNKTDSDSDSDSKNETTTTSAKANFSFEIFKYWCEVMNKPSAKPTAKRIKVVKDRLKEGYSIEQIKSAIDGCSITPHNNGTDPKGNGQKYDDLELICRRGEHVERFIENDLRFKTQGSFIKQEKSMSQLAEEMIRDGDV